MNLSPIWVQCLREAGWEAAHWGTVGDPRATDSEIMRFAREEGWVIFTHDLEFSAILAHTQAGRPSVFQVRAQVVSPGGLGPLVLRTLRQFTAELETGAIVTVDAARQRVRLLPLTP